MQLKASTDYGLRTVLYLAAKGGTCSSKDISEDMAIPRDYLIQLAQLLRKAGIIEAQPGKNGGYRLSKEPSETTLLEVMEALATDPKESVRQRLEARENAPMVLEIRNAFELLSASNDAYLNSITLDLLLESADNSERARELLAERLQEESQRLLGAE